jgi:hypothetical protein
MSALSKQLLRLYPNQDQSFFAVTNQWRMQITGKKMIRVPYNQGVGETFVREPESP